MTQFMRNQSGEWVQCDIGKDVLVQGKLADREEEVLD